MAVLLGVGLTVGSALRGVNRITMQAKVADILMLIFGPALVVTAIWGRGISSTAFGSPNAEELTLFGRIVFALLGIAVFWTGFSRLFLS